ncbi:MAG: hypothetical protein GXY77_13610, partial [Fibrobacter sp.]|nr:hypothetical protein [Fibrobacter sp.]
MKNGLISRFMLVACCTGQITCSSNDNPATSHFIAPPPSHSNAESKVTIDGITWFFDKDYPVGRFANGDYWVAGDTVIITRITPDFDGEQNGWEVNPIVDGPQG